MLISAYMTADGHGIMTNKEYFLKDGSKVRVVSFGDPSDGTCIDSDFNEWQPHDLFEKDPTKQLNLVIMMGSTGPYKVIKCDGTNKVQTVDGQWHEFPSMLVISGTFDECVENFKNKLKLFMEKLYDEQN